MGALAILLSLVLIGLLAATATAKLTGQPGVMRNLDHIGVARFSSTIAGAELALAVTMVLGLFDDTLRLVGALGVMLLVGTVVGFQLRAGERGDDLVPPAIVVVLALIVALGSR